jgi:hypothetical protein
MGCVGGRQAKATIGPDLVFAKTGLGEQDRVLVDRAGSAVADFGQALGQRLDFCAGPAHVSL